MLFAAVVLRGVHANELAGESVPIQQRVTNIYRREAGQWQLVHRHTDISPAMLGVLEHPQAA